MPVHSLMSMSVSGKRNERRHFQETHIATAVIFSGAQPDTICEFITQHTYLNGKKFSFEGHEYQKEIRRPAQTIVIVKSAQLGISDECRLL